MNSIFMLDAKTSTIDEFAKLLIYILLGISNSTNASKASGQWLRAKKFIQQGKDISGIKYRWNADAEEEMLKAENKKTKSESARDFILYFSREFGDTIPGSEGTLCILLYVLIKVYLYII